jgi:hypothetical protein
MRVALVAIVFSLSTLFPAAAQNTPPTNPQALQILQHALTALSPTTATHDVTLSGSVHYIAGSDDETGTAVLKATATGASRIDLSLSSGQRSEVRDLTADPPAGQWSGHDGTNHAIAYHNLLNEPAWFSPVAAISRLLASPGYVATFVGAETLDSQSVQHISVSQQPPSASSSAPLTIPHLTQIDLYLDSSTFLPALMTFNVHPDNNALLDIPVKIRFSDYRSVDGAQIPFRVEKFVNNGLVLDLQLESATVNTGLTASQLNAQ